MNRRLIKSPLLLSMLLLLFSPLAASVETVDEILGAMEAPTGVVFEVIEGNPRDLNWVMPKIRADVDRLRAKFPDIAVAVVSHGREEFGLTKEHAATMPRVHSLVKDLSENRDARSMSAARTPPGTTWRPKSSPTT